MDCIYRVRENWGNHGGHNMYYERQAITGKMSEFFPDNTAFIDYRVRQIEDGIWWNEFELFTSAGELVALKRWSQSFDSVHFAKAETLRRAVEKVGQFKGYVECKVANTDAEALIKKFMAKGEAERTAVNDTISQAI
jgi:hypothetical protein